MKDKLVENIKNCISSAILYEVSSSLMRRAAAKQR